MISLPSEKSKASTNFDHYTMLFFAPPKRGKSTIASQFPEPIFLATEPGLRFLDVFKVDIGTWEDFCEAGALLLNQTPRKFKTIVIDTTDNLFKFCEDYVCKKMGIDSPGDAGWAKGWSALKAEFTRPILKLVSSDYNFIFISHDKETEVKSRVVNYTKISPTLTGTARKVILPLVDIIAYLDIDVIKDKNGSVISQDRVLITEGNESLEVGARGSVSFRFPERIVIPDPSKANAYECIMKAIKEVNK